MTEFDRTNLRDTTFRQRFDQKVADIRAVQARHTFLDYTLHESLIDDLEAIYQENLRAYETSYLARQQDWDQLSQQLTASDGLIHDRHYEAVAALLEQARALLAIEDYAQNDAAAPLLAQARQALAAARATWHTWQEHLRSRALFLDQQRIHIWAEDWQAFQQRLEAARKALYQGDTPPADDQLLPQADLDEACAAKTRDLATLPRGLAARWPARVVTLRDTAAPRSDYATLLVDWQRVRRQRWRAIAAGATAAVLVVAAIVWLGPQGYERLGERQAWTAATSAGDYAAYEAYLRRYPHGRYAAQALAVQATLGEGRVSGLADRQGRRYDYDGALRNRLPHGYGAAVFADGATYTGYWKQGLRDSLGTYTASDSSHYTGAWRDDRRHGRGSYTDAAGNRYEGEWQDDRYHGRGTLHRADGSSYEGQWRQNERHGQGTWRSADGQVYAGAWQSDQWQGRGIWQDSSGLRYEGDWVAGLREGTGRQTWPSGLVYDGGWKSGQRWGPGTLTWTNGAYFNGVWRADSLDGHGTLVTRFRAEMSGIWRGDLSRAILSDAGSNLIAIGRIEDGLFIGGQ
ncbi:MAG: hypothetical protein OHK0039_41630 [Bacteroidia bacterium]